MRLERIAGCEIVGWRGGLQGAGEVEGEREGGKGGDGRGAADLRRL